MPVYMNDQTIDILVGTLQALKQERAERRALEQEVVRLTGSEVSTSSEALDVHCNSLEVAELLEKKHKNVLQAIRNLDCSDGFRESNFRVSAYPIPTGQGGTRYGKMYDMTKDGFIFLVSEFTGKKATRVREEFFTTAQNW